jgi:hypothetical protein
MPIRWFEAASVLQSCAKPAPDLKPSGGLDHLPNALLFYWFQGYLSAANIYLLSEYTDYIDTGAVEAETVVSLVAKFCGKSRQAAGQCDRQVHPGRHQD